MGHIRTLVKLAIYKSLVTYQDNMRLLIICIIGRIFVFEEYPLKHVRMTIMALKPGPKPIAKSTGKPDQRRRDNKNTPGNTPGLKPSKSSQK